MFPENFVEIGTILKTHGVKGNVIIAFDADFEDIKKTDVLFIEIDKIAVPFFLATNLQPILKNNQQTTVAKFDTINTIEDAKKLLNKKILFPLNKANKYSNMKFNNINNFDLISQENEYLGQVEEVIHYEGHSLIKTTYKGNELLIPFHEDLIIDFKPEIEVLKLIIADGLLNT